MANKQREKPTGEKPTEEKPRLSLWRIIGNNVFLIRMICRSVPGLIAIQLFQAFCTGAVSFFTGSYIIRYALNGIEDGKPFSVMLSLLLGALVLILLVNLLTNCLGRVNVLKFADLEKKVSAAVYAKAARMELACYEDPAYYDSFSKAVDECNTRPAALVQTLYDGGFFLVTFSANFGLLAAIDWRLVLFAFVPLLTVPLASRLNKLGYDQQMAVVEQNRRKKYARRTFYLADYAKEMRLTAMPELMFLRFREAGNEIVRIFRAYGWSKTALSYCIGLFSDILTPLGATFYAVWQTLGTGNMGIGDCVVVASAVSQVSGVLVNLLNLLLQFQEHALYIENLREFLDHEPTIVSGDAPLPPTGDLSVEDVSFRYLGADHDSLSHIRMHIGAKEKIAIVGHNGAGKSTLIKLLLRLYDPTEGKITYAGEDIRSFPVDAYRLSFGAVMQETPVFALSVAENVLRRPYGEDESVRVREALEQSGLAEKVDRFTKKEQTVLTREFDENGENLSGGQAQKLAIAHVFAGENRFVILDEPSSALDPIAEYEMYRRMSEACRDCGMIFISHRLSAAVSADRIYLMEKGQIVEEGTHDQLMAKNGHYAAMFKRQAENYGEVTVCRPEE